MKFVAIFVIIGILNSCIKQEKTVISNSANLEHGIKELLEYCDWKEDLVNANNKKDLPVFNCIPELRNEYKAKRSKIPEFLDIYQQIYNSRIKNIKGIKIEDRIKYCDDIFLSEKIVKEKVTTLLSSLDNKFDCKKDIRDISNEMLAESLIELKSINSVGRDYVRKIIESQDCWYSRQSVLDQEISYRKWEDGSQFIREQEREFQKNEKMLAKKYGFKEIMPMSDISSIESMKKIKTILFRNALDGQHVYDKKKNIILSSIFDNLHIRGTNYIYEYSVDNYDIYSGRKGYKIAIIKEDKDKITGNIGILDGCYYRIINQKRFADINKAQIDVLVVKHVECPEFFDAYMKKQDNFL